MPLQTASTESGFWEKLTHRLTPNRVISLCLTFLFVALLSWAISSPVGATPDEDYHLASIWCGQGFRENYCEPATAKNERVIPETLLRASQCFAFAPGQPAGCIDYSSEPKISTSRVNSNSSYPPIFYWANSWFVSGSIEISVLLMRIFNALIFIVPLGILAILSKISIRKSLLIGTLVALIPLGMFIIPSINPSSWAISSAVITWGSVYSLLVEPKISRKFVFGALAVFGIIIGAGSRSDSAAYAILAIGVAAVLARVELGRFSKAFVFPAVISAIPIIFFFASGQSAVVGAQNASQPLVDISLPQLIAKNLLELPSLMIGSLGTWGLGWLDTQMPATVWVSSVFCLISILFSGIKFMNSGKTITMVTTFAAMVVVPLYVLVHDHILVGAGVQPRYIFPLLIILVQLSLYATPMVSSFFSRSQIFIIVALMAAANAIALHFNTRRYVTGITANGWNLNANNAWWWNFSIISPMANWAIGSLAFLIALVFVFCFRFEKQVVKSSLSSS